MSWPVAFFILLGVAALTVVVTWTEEATEWVAWKPPAIENIVCGEIAALSPDEFRVWLAPKDTRTLPQVMACILEEARR